MASCELSEDLVIHILSWLPIVSLMRFKCVCKSWCAFIGNSNFITKHLNHAALNQRENDTLLFKYYSHVFDKDTFLLLSGENFEMSVSIYLPSFSKESEGRLEMLSSCNGIICLHDEKYGDLAMWNPATRKLRALPESHFPCLPGSKKGSVCGFGFDAKTNDYKVIRIVYHYKQFGRPMSYHVELYSLSTNSWRLIGEVMPVTYIVSGRGSKAYLNGNYCWWGKYNNNDDQAMISFNMSDEVFQTTPLPGVCSVTIYGGYLKSFAVLNESIALILFPCKDVQCFEIWLLTEFGNKESWTKLYTIGPISGLAFPLGFSKNGAFFMRNKFGQLIFSDPISREIRNIQVQGIASSLEVLVYKESLVSIDGGNDLA